MNTTPFKFSLLFFLISVCINAKAQRFDSLLNRLDKEYPQEKIYIHFDRSAYNAGETIWLKAYLFSENNPSLISKNIYTELLDASGKVLERKISPVVMSSSAASFDIPADISAPVVYIRAYTKWMLNFDSAFLFTKAIPILTFKPTSGKSNSTSTPKTISTNTAAATPLFFLQFFPEGGDMVEGVESRIAFKATDRTGMPINVSGVVTDSKKNKVASFSSIHDGMGTFIMQPKNDEQYKATWTDRMGHVHETALPVAKPNGVVMQTNTLANQIEFNIKRQAVASPFPYVYVVAQMNQQLIYRAKATISKSANITGNIPVDNLPGGIVQITLFDPDEKPIAERIVFINQSEASFITDLNSAIKDLGKRKKNTIEIDVPDTIACNLSVAVTDAELDPAKAEDDIFSHVLLTSDVKGYVHNPAYYFSSDADSVADHLDLVMMTNGWRRFRWEDLLAGHFRKLNYLPENYLSIEGKVYGVNKSLLANKELVGILQLKNGSKEIFSTSVHQDGNFLIPNTIFYDTAKFYYQINNDKRQSLTERASFDIKNNFLKDPLHQKPDSMSLFALFKPDTMVLAKNKEVSQEELSMVDDSKVTTLKTVVIRTRQKSKKELMDEEYTSGFFSGGDARVFLPDDDPAFLSSQNVLQYLQGRVAGLQINLTGNTPSLTWRGNSVTLFMNEIQETPDMIENLSMSDVAMVKVFSPPFFGAMGGGSGGAIAVYLKKGMSANQATKGLDNSNISGYSPVKEFYSPDYSKTDSIYSPDYRSTLYWNPFVITDKEHRRIFLSFYNNDITKKMRVIIEGINMEGKLTRTEKIFQ